MNDRFENLVEKAQNDPYYLVELLAVVLEKIASSNKEKIVNLQQLVNNLIDKHRKINPLSDVLKHTNNGFINFYLTNFNEAKVDLKAAISAHKPGMPLGLKGAIYMGMGSNYRSLGVIDLAVEYQLKAIELIDKDGFYAMTYAYSYYQLGEIHVSIGEYDSAKHYYEEALEIITKTTNSSANFRINNGLGICYMHLNDFDSCYRFLKQSLEVEGISGAERARGLCDLGILFVKKKELKEAEKCLSESYKIRKDNKLEDAASTSLIHLGSVYLQKKNVDKAIEMLKEALSISERYNSLAKKIKVLKLLAKAFELKGDSIRALSIYNEYDKLDKEVRSEQVSNIFRLKNNQIEAQKQRVQQKNVELKSTLDELARVKNSRKSLFFSIGTAIILVLLTEAFFDPLVDSYTYNVYLSLGVKIVIALMLKPMESFYERILFRKAMKLNKT